MIKNLIFSCLAAFVFISMTGCADDDHHCSTCDSSSMSMDSKDMHHRHHHN